MDTFFYGWPRKAGFVLLVMACVVVGFWYRSHYENDALLLALGNRQHEIQSGYDGLAWISWDILQGNEDGHTGWNSSQFHEPIMIIEQRDVDCRFEKVAIPFWPVVLTLTLLSACLILWKPRKPDRGLSNV
jgi:hypothetical protein